MPLAVTIVHTPEEMKVAHELRRRVFQVEQGVSASLELDDHDNEDTTVHFIGKDVEQDEYVAVARVLLDPAARKAKIGRVGVLAECRGKKFGVALMNAIEAALRERVDAFVLSAQFDKKIFYEKCGYECPSDEVYYEANIKHCWMIKSAAS